MKEYLDEKEAQVSRTITNITDTLPSSVASFAHSLEKDNVRSIGSIYQYVLDIRLFYLILSEKWNVEPKDIDDKELSKVTPTLVDEYINALYKPNRIVAEPTAPDQKRKDKRYKSLWYYFDYLERTGIIKENDPNGGYAKYRFSVKDEERDVFFTDESGETLYLNGNEARDFVKSLYAKPKKERHT